MSTFKNRNKENRYISNDKFYHISDQYGQQSNPCQYSPWNINFFLDSKTPLRRINPMQSNKKNIPVKLNQTFSRRKQTTQSEQLKLFDTIASQLKKQAEYLDSDLEQLDIPFLRFSTDVDVKLRRQRISQIVKSNNFVFNYSQEKRKLPKRQNYNKYLRLNNHSYQSESLQDTSSKQMIVFSKISRKGTQHESYNHHKKKLMKPLKSCSTLHISKDSKLLSPKEGQKKLFSNFNRLTKGRKLKKLKMKLDDML